MKRAGVFFSVPWHNQIHISQYSCGTHGHTEPNYLQNLLPCFHNRRETNHAAKKKRSGFNRSEGNRGMPSCPEYSAYWVLLQRFWGKTLLREYCNVYFFQMWGWAGSNICHPIHICNALWHFLFTSLIFPVGRPVPHGPKPCLILNIWWAKFIE